MWIVKLALRRPYTFIVLAIVITLFGVFAIWRTPTDIFPNIRIPVVATVWKYTGLSPEEMATRLILNGERTAQTTVNDDGLRGALAVEDEAGCHLLRG